MSKLFKLSFISLCFVLLLALQSCMGCSNSGRAQIIAKAKTEAEKNQTLPEPATMVKDIVPEAVQIDDIITPSEEKVIRKELIKNRIPPAQGKLIQVEGLVLKEVLELTIRLETSESQVDQILTMRNYIQTNWHYVFDPDVGSDTWRSAEATLSLKYQGKYSGDCDDFAILLASLAKQIGLRSRMVGGFDDDYGHAFAEFLVPNNELYNTHLRGLDYREDQYGIWISLDWFQGDEHNRFTEFVRIFEDI